MLDSQSLRKITARTLRHHFFRRFFDNDTLSADGDMERSVVRALCICAVPGLMVAFWLLPAYPGRPLWAMAADRYFFVLCSFVIMGIATTFEWEMLFPDRADFLILLPLPIEARQLFYAKGRALLTFLALFLAAANIFAMILFPAVSTGSHRNIVPTFLSHAVSTLLSGIFSASAMLAIEGLSIALLPDSWQRWIATILQSLAITVLLLLFLLFPLFSSHMQTLLDGHAAFTRYIPPLWFLGLYEHLAMGSTAPAGASALASTGLYATACTSVLALLAYPLAWSRQKKRAMEGTSQVRKPSGAWLVHWLHKALLRRPQERAIFHFISHTLRRNARYQVYLAIYSGVGLALAITSALTLQYTRQHTLVLALSNRGLHAVLPLLLFWLAVGLRVAFGFPVDMLARWVFPINLLRTGQHARATGTWVLLCCALLTGCVLCVLFALGWPAYLLLQQALWSIALSVLLTDLLFINRSRIPFTQPRLPGRANLPIMLVLYAAAFPVFVLLTVVCEIQSESQPTLLLRVLLGIAALHFALRIAAGRSESSSLSGYSLDEPDDEFQTLGLSHYS